MCTQWNGPQGMQYKFKEKSHKGARNMKLNDLYILVIFGDLKSFLIVSFIMIDMHQK